MFFKLSRTKFQPTMLDPGLEGRTLLSTSINQPSWLWGGDHPATEYLACGNALVHVPSFVKKDPSIIPPTPAYFSPNAVPFDFEPKAPKPEKWLKFLRDIWPDDPESIELLQQWFGYLLLPTTEKHKILLLIGEKRSGKGTIAHIIQKVVGEGNCVSPILSELGTQFGKQPLIGKSVAIVGDARIGGRADIASVVETLLSISGEDSQTVPRKFMDAVNTKLSVRFMVLTNELPRLHDSSGALASRMLVLRTGPSFYGNEDETLRATLEAELPSILLWAIEGWKLLKERRRFTVPKSSEEDIRDLEELTSPIEAFIRDKCEVGPYETDVPTLYAAWKAWCEENGKIHPGERNVFSRNLRSARRSIRTVQRRTGFGRERFFEGIKLC